MFRKQTAATKFSYHPGYHLACHWTSCDSVPNAFSLAPMMSPPPTHSLELSRLPSFILVGELLLRWDHDYECVQAQFWLPIGIRFLSMYGRRFTTLAYFPTELKRHTSWMPSHWLNLNIDVSLVLLVFKREKIHDALSFVHDWLFFLWSHNQIYYQVIRLKKHALLCDN